MKTELFEIIHEDEDLLVINKPAGLVCHPTKGDMMSSLSGRIRHYLSETSKVHMINRLDRETSGIVLVGKTPDCTRELRKCFELRNVTKEYLAVVTEWLPHEETLVDAPLGKDLESPVAIKDKVCERGSSSQTRIRVIKRFEIDGSRYTLAHVHPLTGRKHQIRIHLSYIGHPIVGDKLYGADQHYYLDFVKGELSVEAWRELKTPHHALHCGRIEFCNIKQYKEFIAPPEPWFLEFAGI